MDRISLYINWILNDRRERKFEETINQEYIKELDRTLALDDDTHRYRKQRELMELSSLIGAKKFSTSKETLDVFIRLPYGYFENLLMNYKYGLYGKRVSMSSIYRVDTPLIRMMDYFLEKCVYDHLYLVSKKLEYEVLKVWVELTCEKIQEEIKSNLNNPDILFMFTMLRNNNFEIISIKDYPFTIKDSSYNAIKEFFLDTKIAKEDYLIKEFFTKAFINFDLFGQISLVELLEKSESDVAFIKKLHKLLNKDVELTEFNFTMVAFEMSYSKFAYLMKIIEKSSYFKKKEVKNTKIWEILMAGYNKDIDLTIDYYSQIMDLYHLCREYATKSIVKALYPLDTLSKKINYLDVDGVFNILVKTMEKITDIKFELDGFLSFSIITEKNFSHFTDVGYLYGYYTDITPDLIAHIFPMDALSIGSAKFEYQITEKYNLLLDIDDLNEETLKRRTYNELSIRSNNNGKVFYPNCIICIDKVSSDIEEAAEEMNLPILVLKKTPNTIENNRDIYENLP